MATPGTDDRVTDEVEALKAILLDHELHIKENKKGEPECIETIVFPSTAEDSQSQYVCVRLVVHLPPGYPDVAPIITLRNPRGLHEDTVRLIQSDAETKCQDFVGQPVMFELIELVREHLTCSNLPSGQCAVCLYGFREGDEFTKTECYHHFHSHCLGAHVAAAERHYREEQEKVPQWQQDPKNKFQAICPVCREPIECDVENLSTAPPPLDVETAKDFAVTAELRELQHQMAALFLHQQQRGGIIDLEAEGVKMLLRTEEDSSATTEELSPPGTSLTALRNPEEPAVTQVVRNLNLALAFERNKLNSELSVNLNFEQQPTQQYPEQHKANQPNQQYQSRQSNQQHQRHNNHGHRNRGRGRAHTRRYFDKMRQPEANPR